MSAVPRATRPPPPPPRVPAASEEMWLAKRLGRARDLYLGTITPRDRAERVRETIIAMRVWNTTAGRRLGGVEETYGELFERLYGEPLFINATTNGETENGNSSSAHG